MHLPLAQLGTIRCFMDSLDQLGAFNENLHCYNNILYHTYKVYLDIVCLYGDLGAILWSTCSCLDHGLVADFHLVYAGLTGDLPAQAQP